MPRIGLNGLLLDSPHSGTATYTRNLGRLLGQVSPDFEPTVYLRNGDWDGREACAVRLRSPIDGLPGPIGRRTSKLAWEEVFLPAASAARRDEVLHYPYFAAPALAAAQVVTTVHDLIPLVLEGFHRSRQSASYARFMAWSVRRSAAVITVSEYSRREIVRVLGIPDTRVHVTPEAAGDEFSPLSAPDEGALLQEKYRLPPRFVLYLGGAERRKNIETLVRAWAQPELRKRIDGVGLVVAAQFPPADSLYPDIPRLARDLNLTDVHFLPGVDENDKAALYRAASLFAFPSTYEGFGLPPLEAMACGTPVIASNATSLPEVVADAAVLLPPLRPDLWAEALEQVLLSEPRQAELRARGLRRAAEFSWRKTAERTIEVYRSVLSR